MVALAKNTEQKSVKEVKVSLTMLCIMFVFSILSLQAFLYQYTEIGTAIGADSTTSTFLISLPPIFMGVAAFIYASLADFVSIRKIFVTGFIVFMVGSVLGCLFGYLIPSADGQLAFIVLARCIQAFGGQIAGSCFLVLAGRYLEGKERVVFYGIFTAMYQLGAGLGALASSVLLGVWPLIFLIPCVSIFLFIPCVKNMPGLVEGAEKSAGHIDAFGFAIFTVFAGFLITFIQFISNPAFLWTLWVAIAALVVFIVWISKAKHPFITPGFFKNGRWILAATSLFIIWFTAYAILPLARATATGVFGIGDVTMAVWLLIPISVAVIMGVLSGSITDKIGRCKAIILGIVLQCIGYLGSAWILGSVNIFVYMLFLAFYWGGYALLYSPLVDTVISTVRPAEMGRGFGMNDLIIALSPSLGMAVFSPMIYGQVFNGQNVSEAAPMFSGIFLLYLIPAILGVAFYLVSRRKIESAS